MPGNAPGPTHAFPCKQTQPTTKDPSVHVGLMVYRPPKAGDL